MTRNFIAIVAIAALLASGTALSGNDSPTHRNKLSIEKDVATGIWHAKCLIEVTGIDKRQIYSGVMLFQYAPNDSSTTTVFNAIFQVSPSAKVWTESSVDSYVVTAALEGKSVEARADVTLPAYNAGDSLFCDARIDSGVQPAVPGQTIFGANMRSTVLTP